MLDGSITTAVLAGTLDPIVLVSEGGGAPTVGPIRGAVVAALVLVGAFFLIVGTVGLVRLPDIYNRMHATSKATTIGAASILLANTAYFGPRGAGLVSLVGIVFLFVTAPTGSHMISRAAQRMGVDFAGDVTWPAGGDEVDDPTEGDDAEPADD
jgi:multicomponent Na+:H+ antiporter subunit G